MRGHVQFNKYTHIYTHIYGDGNGAGGGNGDGNGDRDGDKVETKTGVEPSERTQDGNGDGNESSNGDERDDGDGIGDGNGKGRGGGRSRVEDQTLPFRKRHHFCRQEVALAGSHQLRVQDPVLTRPCGAEGRTGHQRREEGNDDGNRVGGGR